MFPRKTIIFRLTMPQVVVYELKVKRELKMSTSKCSDWLRSKVKSLKIVSATSKYSLQKRKIICGKATQKMRNAMRRFKSFMNPLADKLTSAQLKYVRSKSCLNNVKRTTK